MLSSLFYLHVKNILKELKKSIKGYVKGGRTKRRGSEP